MMPPLSTLALCAALPASALFLAGAGVGVLRILKIAEQSALDFLLYSLTAGVVLLELAVSLGELAPSVRVGVQVSVVAVAVCALPGIPLVLSAIATVLRSAMQLRGIARILFTALFLVVTLQMLASLAPMTGSDALHYHFTMQSLYLQDGFAAPWSLLHGFFCGLSHQLILAALALGSSGLAQGWLFLGGTVGAIATYRITRLWCDGVWPWLAALAFTLTPVTLWQTTAAGAPDIWMCAFVPLGLLAILKSQAAPKPGTIILAGIFAGAAAGTKYTGAIFAAALLVAFGYALRSARSTGAFFASAVITGLAPYLRNWVWTGNPVFPFFFSQMHRSGLLPNRTALASIMEDTGASHGFHMLDLLRFPLFVAVEQNHLGPWQLLGSLVLAFGPLAILPLWKSFEGRVAMLVWILGAIGIGVSSAMPRFLLPVLPIALAASIGGVELLTRERFRVVRLLAVLSISGFVLAGLGAMLVYSRPALAMVVGSTSTEAYLVANSPDYERSQFVNREVERFDQRGRTLVFFRHLYYLRVPFENGDPENSWEIDPKGFSSDEAWKKFFVQHQIRWVARTPDYPAPLVESLTRLERDNVLLPCASGEGESFAGNRMEGKRVKLPMTLLCVANGEPAK